ncbi:MAG TPA: hypothetical protein VGQ80_14645, partial [Acidimicrobiia bacterium]|nr:hypothetical protein [Acidimicrobiia bacterium]
LVLVSLIGGCETLLASAGGRCARPGVRQAFLAGSTALVVTAAAVTSWAAGAGHDHPAALHGGAKGALASSVDGSHGHGADRVASGDPAAGSAVGDAAPAPARHDHGPAGDGTTASGDGTTAGGDGVDRGPAGSAAAGHDHSAAGTSEGAGPSDSAGATHDQAATGSAATGRAPSGSGPAAGGATHEHGTGPAGEPGPGAGPAGDGGAADGGHHPGTGAGAAQPPGSGAPQGTWVEVRYGPFVIPPESAGGGADHSDIVVPTLTKPCSNCFLQQMEPDLVYADDSPANLDTGLMLHHAVLFSAGRPDATCGPSEPFPGKLGQRFFAAGNERTPGLFPPGFGYYVDSGNWSGIFHIMNHSAEARSVYFRLNVRWSPAKEGGILPLTPLWLDMNNCRTSEYAVPAGPSSSHWTWTSNVTGRIVSTAGHVHNGGLRTTLSNHTTGDHLCTSWAGWGKKAAYQGSIESMSACTWDRVGTVQKGQVLDLETTYDAPQPVPDAMGIMMAFVFETTDLAAGTPAPARVRGEGPAPAESTPPPSSGHDHH